MNVVGSSTNASSHNAGLERATMYFWRTEARQAKSQRDGSDRGRASVTGGQQMDGFASLITDVLQEKGISAQSIHHRTEVELPGYYRPTKKWDLLVVDGGRLLAAMEFKSQVGPSFGNNVNNRAEEAIGSAVDLRKAYAKGALATSPEPWLGYLFLLHKDPRSVREVAVNEPNYSVFPEFRNASYARRYELLCERLVTERLYDAACFLLSPRTFKGSYEEPNSALSFHAFMDSLLSHVTSYMGTRSQSTLVV